MVRYATSSVNILLTILAAISRAFGGYSRDKLGFVQNYSQGYECAYQADSVDRSESHKTSPLNVEEVLFSSLILTLAPAALAG